MERGWIDSREDRDERERELEREVFQRVFGYRAAPGVNVPRFTEDRAMADAILRHVEEAWRPLYIEVKRRATTDPRLAWEVMIRTGRNTGYGGNGPTRGVAICQAALFLAANRAPKRERPE